MLIGCGYVGLTLALVMARNGFNVKGYDVNKGLINKLKKYKLPFYEKGINSLLNQQLIKILRLLIYYQTLKSAILILSL